MRTTETAQQVDGRQAALDHETTETTMARRAKKMKRILTDEQKARILAASVGEMVRNHEVDHSAPVRETHEEMVAALEDQGDYSRSYDVYGQPLDPMSAGE